MLKSFEFYYENLKEKCYYELTIKEYKQLIEFENIKTVDE